MIDYPKLILLGLITWQEYRILKRQNYINDLHERLDSRNQQISYLCHLLNKNQIRLDEFDYIALPNVSSIRRETNTD